MEGYRPENLPADAEVIVVGNAIKRGNPEVEEVLNRKLYYLSLPEVLKEYFLRGRHNLVVSGTHGKTTTTSLLTWIFESSGLAPAYMIGGIPNNLGQGACLRDSRHFIIEGDEYDTAFFDKRSKFLHYMPELLIVNNIEFDHADIFNNLDEIKTSFRRLLNIVPGNGMVLLNSDDPNCVSVSENCPAPIVEVGFSANSANQIRDVRYDHDGSHFRLFDAEFFVPLMGEFNVRNSAMAVSAAHFYGLPMAKIQEALRSFKGIRRRQELRGEAGGIKVIDDFAHHPTAIRETLAGLRGRYPNGKLWAVFEPRSNTTRRSVFQNELAVSLQAADGVVLAQVAKLEQIPESERLDPGAVVAAIRAAGKQAFYEPAVPQIIARLLELARPGDVVAILSNGGFDGIHDRLIAALA
jgi:UDP-N-acetylmuramate: L-alanyl-gamma-D-glutamyl-meso-diaminopimelate ligase